MYIKSIFIYFLFELILIQRLDYLYNISYNNSTSDWNSLGKNSIGKGNIEVGKQYNVDGRSCGSMKVCVNRMVVVDIILLIIMLFVAPTAF